MNTTCRLKSLGRPFVAVVRDSDAQGLLEYALIVAFVVLIGIVGMRAFAAHTNNVLSNDAAALPY